MCKKVRSIAGWGAIACLVVVASGMFGCGGSSTDSPTAAAGAPAQTAPDHPTALSLSGNPASSAVVGTTYSFSPSVTASAGSKLTYSVQNKPVWASFDTTSGALSGAPGASDVGTYANIVISAADGSANASLAAFSITVTDVTSGTATVSWTIPTTNSDGTPLTNLGGFRIYYGTAPDSMTKVAQIANPSVSTHAVTNLAPATWYFGIKAYTSSGVESTISNIANKAIH
jgi:Putative Ig domain